MRRHNWVAIFVLAVAGLACSLSGSASDQAVVHLRLPTLTLTRLPTLTPTANPNPVAVAGLAAEAIEATDSAPAPSPLNTARAIAAAPSATPIPGPSFTPASSTVVEAKAVEAAADAADAPAVALSTPATEADTALPTPADTPTSTATATQAPTPTDIPTATATAEPKIETSGWGIAGTRLSTDQFEDRLVLYGDMINNTGSAQALALVTGTFHDAQGQLIASADNIIDYWPIDVVPSGGQVPFELTFLDTQSVANLALSVEAEPSSQTLRQDFEFSELNQWADEAGKYCVAGKVRNSGDALQEYLVIVAILYDGQDKVINFGEEGGPPPSMVGDDSLSFEICDQTLNQEVARYELRAWGR